MKCPNCYTDNAPNAAFCQRCGFNFQPQQYPSPTPQPPRKNKLSTPLIVIGVVIGVCALCGIIGGISTALQKDQPAAQTNSASNAAPPATPTNQKNVAPTAPVPPKETVSNLKWSDYDNVYSTKSNSTDMQKDVLWKNYEGKTVVWSGEVVDVSKGMFGGMAINIKMNQETMTYDIALDLKKDQTDKAMALTKGKRITFSGKLKTAGGAVLPLTMDEGEIK